MYEEAVGTLMTPMFIPIRFIPMFIPLFVVFQAPDMYEEAMQTLMTPILMFILLFIPLQARDVYEEAVQTVMTVRDFTQVFDSYARFEESVIAALLDTQAQLGRGQDGVCSTPKTARAPRERAGQTKTRQGTPKTGAPQSWGRIPVTPLSLCPLTLVTPVSPLRRRCSWSCTWPISSA